MNSKAMDDATLRALRRLPVIEPDRARAERVRHRCHALIAEGAASEEASARFGGLMEPVLAAVLCISYLFAVFQDLLRLYITH